MAPLEVAWPYGAVEILPPLQKYGDDLSVHVLVTCEGAVWDVSDVLGHQYQPTLNRNTVVFV